VPRFFLHQRRDSTFVEDPDGSCLPSLEAARQEALAAARDLWADAIHKGEDLTDYQFVITDERGTHVLFVSFIDALPDGLQRRLVLR
jgi:hypothetical protein